jgi:hypothetical protein
LIALLGRLARARSIRVTQPRFVVGLAVVAFVLVPLRGEALPGPLAAALFALSILVLCFVLAVAIHELGHFAGAWATEMEIELAAVAPIAIVARADRWKVSGWDSWQVPGVVLAGPRDSTDLQRRLVMTVLGGPLASLLSGTSLLFLSTGFKPNTWIWFAFSVVALTSLAIGVTSMWPKQIQGLATDGSLALALLRRDRQGTRLLAVERLHAMASNGQRPRHWDTTVLQDAVAVPDGSYADACGWYFSYLAAVDEGDFELAEAELRAMMARLQTTPQALARDMAAEAAFFVLAHEDLSAEQRAALTKLAPRACAGSDALPRLRALMLLQAGDAGGARSQAQSALRSQEWRGEHGIARLEREWLDELISVTS